jgi:exodeoxyribonuclease VII large subunit
MRSLDRAADRVALLDARAMVHDPALALARGWSITTTADGRAVRDLASIAVGTDLQTRVAGGTIRSTVVATTPDAPNDPDRPDRPDPTSEVDQP